MSHVEEQIATPLKNAIRLFWDASKLLDQDKAEGAEPSVLENREHTVRCAEALVEQFQQETTTLVLTGDNDYDFDDDQIDIGAIEMLLQKRIIHECLDCEEDAGLASVYDGDHREFHLSGDHHETCVYKALHEYDPERWPTYEPPEDEYDTCEECGVKVA